MRAIVKAILDLKREVDELREKMVTLTHGNAAPPKAVPSGEDEAEWQEIQEASSLAAPASMSMRQNNDELIRAALEKHTGNVKAAAEELGVSERTIYRWRAQHKEQK